MNSAVKYLSGSLPAPELIWAALAGPLLGERVGLGHWASIVVGFLAPPAMRFTSS